MLGKLLGLLAVLLVAGAVALAIILPRRARAADVHAWLVCGDCQGGELARVVRHRGKVVDPLRDALLDGPSPARRGAIAAQSAEVYLGRSPAQVGEYVAHDVANYVALYQGRAIHALLNLADSGVTGAATALTACWDSAQAGSRAYRTDVWRQLELAAAVAAAPGRATVGGVTAAFGDTIAIGRASTPAWGAATTLSLIGSPFADDLVLFRSSDTLRFLAVGWVARHLVRVVPDPNTPPEWSELFIDRIRYRMHTAAAADTIAPGDSSARFAALRRGTDFHLLLGHAPEVLAELDWSGSGVVWPEWRRCTQPDSLMEWGSPSVGQVAGRVLSGGLPLAGARVAVLGTAVAAMTDTLGQFDLTVPGAGTTPLDVSVDAAGHAPLRFTAHVGVGSGYEVRLARVGRPALAGVTLPSHAFAPCLFLAVRVDSTPVGAEPVLARVRVRWP